MVHFQRGFEAQWLSLTFSKAIFLGNGLVAILAGLLANTLVTSLSLGPVAPFDAASVALFVGMVVILRTWTENYGDDSKGRTLFNQFREAASAIASGGEAFQSPLSLLIFPCAPHRLKFLLHLMMSFCWTFHFR